MTDLPVTFSDREVCTALGISPEKLDALIRDGKVGYFIAKRRKRFFPENVAQIRAAIEVVPQSDTDALTRIGVTSRSVARRRRTA